VDKPDLVGVHETRVAHHVAAVGEVDRQYGSTAVCNGARSVVVERFIVVRADVAPGECLLQMPVEGGIDRHHVLEVAVDGAVLHHQDFPVPLHDPRLDFPNLLMEQVFVILLSVEGSPAGFPERILGRASPSHVASPEEALASPTISARVYRTISA
jgi:hypothetical protein